MGALKDCEAVTGSLLGQPVNTLTSLVFIIGGLAILRFTRARWVALGLMATGVGSVLFHGPMPPYAEWAHDVSLAWLLLTVLGTIAGWRPWLHLTGLATISLALGLFPSLGDPLGAVLGAGAVLSVLIHSRSSYPRARPLGPVALLIVAGIVGRLGATGNPLCAPDSVLQPHGLWHIGATIAVVWWVMMTEGGRPPSTNS